jgi:DNA-binding CsgD family transcriptional regulator/tetratricopeptide (TPR) repeat protein
MAARDGRALIERGHEHDVLVGVLDAAQRGEGRAVVLEGPPGIGKSRVLELGRELAASAGVGVLAARGRAPETGFSFGVARQLFDRALSRPVRSQPALTGPAAQAVSLLDGQVPDLGAAGDARELLAAHRLYWLTVVLAERGPLLLVVDDLQWADPASVRYLAYLQHRLAELPIALMLATRTGERPPLLEGIVSDPQATTLRLAPLSQTGVRELVSAALPGAAEEILDACARVSDGNPLLVQELVRTMRLEAWSLDARDAHRLDGVASEAIARAVLTRLRLLPPAAGRLARALAVLGGEAPLRRAAALAGLGARDAVRAADDLVSAEVLAGVQPLVFVHSLVHQAVYEEIPAARRADAHLRAGRLLADERLGHEIVATQLMTARADGGVWVVEELSAAAAAASARGDQRAAASYLRRALEEPPPPDDQCAVLLALGRTEAALGLPEALTHFEQALTRTSDRRQRAEILNETGRALLTSGRMREAASAFQRGSDELVTAGDFEPEEELALELEASRVAAALYGTAATASAFPQKGDVTAGQRAPRTRGERSLLGVMASAQILRGEDRAGALALARRAWDGGPLADDASPNGLNAYSPCFVVINAGELNEALTMCDAALRDARERGSPIGYATACYWRLIVQYRLGRLAEAVADGEAVIDAAAEGWAVAPAGAAGLLAICLLDRGELAEAAALLARFSPERESADAATDARWYEASAFVALAQGDPRHALELALRSERLHVAGGLVNPAVNDWRSPAALAHARLDNHPRAQRIAGENVSLARAFGEPRALGIALRTAGLVARPEERGALLDEAVATLRSSPAELELARTLLESGAHIRRTGAPRASRAPLREALTLAVRCQAGALSRRANEELAASGARPRRTALRGPDALTPAERRVALLAAEGMTNRQIAQALFVTPKTVEKHISNTYGKLGIGSRNALVAALAHERPTPSDASKDPRAEHPSDDVLAPG